jgi:hypothetical protein
VVAISVAGIVALARPATPFHALTRLVEATTTTATRITDVAVLAALFTFQMFADVPERLLCATTVRRSAFTGVLWLAATFLVTDAADLSVLARLSDGTMLYRLSNNGQVNISLRSGLTTLTELGTRNARQAARGAPFMDVRAGLVRLVTTAMRAAMPKYQLVEAAARACDQAGTWVVMLLVPLVAALWLAAVGPRTAGSVLPWGDAACLSDMLRKVHPDLVAASFAPIALANHRTKLRDGNTHSAHGTNWMLVWHAVTGAIAAAALYIAPLLAYSRDASLVHRVFVMHDNLTRWFQPAASLAAVPALKMLEVAKPGYARALRHVPGLIGGGRHAQYHP